MIDQTTCELMAMPVGHDDMKGTQRSHHDFTNDSHWGRTCFWIADPILNYFSILKVALLLLSLLLLIALFQYFDARRNKSVIWGAAIWQTSARDRSWAAMASVFCLAPPCSSRASSSSRCNSWGGFTKIVDDCAFQFRRNLKTLRLSLPHTKNQIRIRFQENKPNHPGREFERTRAVAMNNLLVKCRKYLNESGEKNITVVEWQLWDCGISHSKKSNCSQIPFPSVYSPSGSVDK